MKKRFRLGLTLLLVCLTFAALTLCASAETKTGTCGDDVTYTLDTDTGVLTISGEGEMTSHPWTADTDSIRTVVIEDGVTSIAKYAFTSCGNLASVSIPDSMEVIESYAFGACKSLTEIVIPDSVTDISSFAFYNCGLVKITIPFVGAARDAQTKREKTFGYIFGDSYQEDRNKGYNNINFVPQTLKQVIVSGSCAIPSDAFAYCKCIELVTIEDGVYRVGASAFLNCEALSGVSIADSVVDIGSSVFGGCSRLTEVALPKSNIGIPASAFSSCSALTHIDIPDGTPSIGGSAFSHCSSLRKIRIPNSVQTIGDNALSGCDAITEISVPFVPVWYKIFGASSNYEINASLKKISITGETALRSGAFSNLRKMTDLSISAQVTEISSYAFTGCTRLKTIHVDESNPVYAFESGLLIDKQKGELVSAVSTLSGSCTIPSIVVSIDENAFTNCKTLRELTLPASVANVSDSAFSGCTSLTALRFINSNCEISTSSNALPTTVTIYGFAGSTAEAYAKKYNRTFVALEPTSLTAKVSAATYASGTATLRVTATPTVTEGMAVERYGVFFAPAKYADSYATNGQVVAKDGVLENGKSFAADLTDIPESAYDVKIYAWAFVKLIGVSDLVVCPLDPVSIHDIVK